MHVPSDLLTILEELAALHATAATLSQRACDLAAEIDCNYDGAHSHNGHSISRNGELFVSTATCTVEWRGRRCVLGPSLSMKLIHRLSRHPERFFTYGVLVESVWQTRVSDNAVRTLVKRLRRTLKKAGMSELAGAIRGRDRCFGLFLHDLNA